jgi:hypothetical protein
MWSHYADSHQGICLSFIASGTLRLFRDSNPHVVGPVEVTYVTKLPELNLVNLSPDDLFNSITTKSIDWKDENEYRAICREYVPEKLIQYDYRLLASVIAGCKMLDEEFEELKNTVSKMKNVKPLLFRAQKKAREFGLDLIEVKY